MSCSLRVENRYEWRLVSFWKTCAFTQCARIGITEHVFFFFSILFVVLGRFFIIFHNSRSTVSVSFSDIKVSYLMMKSQGRLLSFILKVLNLGAELIIWGVVEKNRSLDVVIFKTEQRNLLLQGLRHLPELGYLCFRGAMFQITEIFWVHKTKFLF